MLRSVVIDNKMLRYLADKINEEIKRDGKITRSFLSNTIWDYEKKGDNMND